MKFKMSLIPYEADTSWIEPILLEIKKCLRTPIPPKHAANCEYGTFLNAIEKIYKHE
tara:strand:- start:569 stop:739 length:171 start_codon:yes stop_codon:yes gene_type:complete